MSRKTFRCPVPRLLRDTLWVGAIALERVAPRSNNRPAAAQMTFHNLSYLDSFGVFHHLDRCPQYHRDRFTRFFVNVRCKFTCVKLRDWQPNRRLCYYRCAHCLLVCSSRSHLSPHFSSDPFTQPRVTYSPAHELIQNLSNLSQSGIISLRVGPPGSHNILRYICMCLKECEPQTSQMK